MAAHSGGSSQATADPYSRIAIDILGPNGLNDVATAIKTGLICLWILQHFLG
ncbi:hypothetical protein IQ260_04460 [Leptolyngbya cf. ectocarpi LEGE 11479]|uniref:Uncharacterized protein n=1 Tax=Leptolyngbya cf. ectocarpi LEGE 11479 TaxID=1828722 RepID=A0A928X1L7_LEPEC|nr:hypothetical protein [Leptolyngbya ectocarpi]MBE9065899.1 hypothetical protein [Leptolyngbya cf. ectocarpi LEGE 11479]